MSLDQQHCVPCEGGVDPLSPERIAELKPQINSAWQLVENNTKIRRVFSFADFKQAMVFINKVADIAESEGHHPDIEIFYNVVTLTLWTHAIGGLFDNDFVLASKIDLL